MKKRIGIVMYQTSRTKGQEVIAESMVKEFNRAGQESYLITGPFADYKRVISKKYFKDNDFVVQRYKDLPIIRVEGHISKWPLRRVILHSFPYILRQIVNKFKLDVLIVHSNNWNGPAEVAQFMIWNKKMGELKSVSRPIVFCYMPHYNPPDPNRYDKLEMSSRMAWDEISMKSILNQASLVLNVTPIEKKQMIDLGAKSRQCYIYPNGVEDKNFQKYKNIRFDSFQKKYDIPSGKKIVSYIGTLEKRKNPLNVLKVAKKLQKRGDIFFVIAGRKSDQWKEIKPLLNQLDNIKYVGEISEKEKIELIKGSCLNITMTRMEIFGIVQLEFMYLGVPVVTSAVDGQKWLIEDKKQGIHINGPDDINGAVKSIPCLIDNPKIRAELGKNAELKAKKYTRSTLIKKLSKKLDRLVLEERKKYSKSILE